MHNKHYNRIKLIFKNYYFFFNFNLFLDTLIFKLWIKIQLNS